MNRIKELFQRKKNNVLSVFFTAGHPELDHTRQIIVELQNSGVDMIEIGIPFSDPMADGPTIQASNFKALGNKFSINTLFEQLQQIREVTEVPLVLMGYLNPIFKYGVENFCKKANECGIDGFILPDLPLREYNLHYKEIFQRYNLCMNFLITPATSPERIKEIDEISEGFIYLVTTFGVTGGQSDFTESQINALQKVADLKLATPVMAGFGIHNKQTFETVCKYANGAIIGSGFIKVLEKSTATQSENIKEFIQSIKS